MIQHVLEHKGNNFLTWRSKTKTGQTYHDKLTKSEYKRELLAHTKRKHEISKSIKLKKNRDKVRHSNNYQRSVPIRDYN